MVLMNFGGIYIDNDVLVVNSLDKYLNFEMVLSYQEPNVIGNLFNIKPKTDLYFNDKVNNMLECDKLLYISIRN